MDMTGELPIFRSIKQPGQFCCSGCASWGNQQFRQGEQLMKSCIAVFIIAGLEYLHDFIEAYEEIQLRHLWPASGPCADRLCLFYIQPRITENDPRVA